MKRLELNLGLEQGDDDSVVISALWLAQLDARIGSFVMCLTEQETDDRYHPNIK